MSGEFLHNFYMYQNAMMKVGTEKQSGSSSVVPNNNLDIDIHEMMSAAVKAELRLTDVINVSDSYNEILKMIM